MNKKQILFFIFFIILGLASFQISIDRIVGSTQNFTLFELLAPVGGMFLGSVLGAVSALVVSILNIFLFRKPINFLSLALILPPVMAAIYFGFKTKKTAIIFPIAIILFLLNPIGKKRLILNSLGATFTAHAVGTIIFLYAFGLTPAIWLALIPVVLMERGVFTIGIWASCLIFNFVLDKVTNFKFASSLKPFVKTELLINAGKSN